MGTDWAALKKDILGDGVIDVEEVKKLQNILYQDGNIDRDEAEFLFELNDATSGKKNAPEWKQFFITALLKHLLEDPNSPSEIDPAEAAWLKQHIGADGQVDILEKALLVELKAKCKVFPDVLASLLE